MNEIEKLEDDMKKVLDDINNEFLEIEGIMKEFIKTEDLKAVLQDIANDLNEFDKRIKRLERR